MAAVPAKTERCHGVWSEITHTGFMTSHDSLPSKQGIAEKQKPVWREGRVVQWLVLPAGFPTPPGTGLSSQKAPVGSLPVPLHLQANSKTTGKSHGDTAYAPCPQLSMAS